MSLILGALAAAAATAGKGKSSYSKGSSKKGSYSRPNYRKGGNSGGYSWGNSSLSGVTDGYNDAVIKNSSQKTGENYDSELLNSYQNGWKNAKSQSERNAFHQAAESLRKQYGYSGGIDGSKYLGFGNGNKYGNDFYRQHQNMYGRMPQLMEKEYFYNEYDDIARMQENAKRAQIQQGINGLQFQKNGINQGFDDIAKQAYIAKRQSENIMPQQLAASGFGGGMAETTNLGLQTNYQNSLNENEIQRQNQLLNIDNSINDLKFSGDSEIAEMKAQASMSAIKAYQQQLAQQLQSYQWQQEFGLENDKFDYGKTQDSIKNSLNRDKYSYEKEYQNDKYQKELQENEYNKKISVAKILGSYGDFSGYEGLGIDTSVMKAQWNKEQALKAAKASGSVKGGRTVKKQSKTNPPKSRELEGEKLEMFKRWWSSSRNKSEFYKTVNQALVNNIISKWDVDQFLKRKA